MLTNQCGCSFMSKIDRSGDVWYKFAGFREAMEATVAECMSRRAAQAAIRLSGEVYSGKRVLPPEIVAMKQQIKAATRNAELFMARLNVVDEGMVRDIVSMKIKLDGLFAKWAKGEAAPIG